MLRYCRARTRWSYLQTLAELLVLLVYYAKPEVDLVRLFEFRVHPHDLGKRLLGVVEGPEPVVEDPNPIPKHGLLQ